MAKVQLYREEVLVLLAAGPARIAALTAGLTPEQLRAPAADGGWSATEILAHLRACADMWTAAIEAMLAEEHPTLRAVNPRKWISSTDYPDLHFAPSLAAYAAQRRALLALLEELPAEAWARTATVTGAGAPFERTVHFYAQWLASHERTSSTLRVWRRQSALRHAKAQLRLTVLSAGRPTHTPHPHKQKRTTRCDTCRPFLFVCSCAHCARGRCY